MDTQKMVPVMKAQENGTWAPGFCNMPPSEHHKKKDNIKENIWVDISMISASAIDLWTIVLIIIVTCLVLKLRVG